MADSHWEGAGSSLKQEARLPSLPSPPRRAGFRHSGRGIQAGKRTILDFCGPLSYKRKRIPCYYGMIRIIYNIMYSIAF